MKETNFLRKITEKRRKNQVFSDGIAKIRKEQQLPKIVELVFEYLPKLKNAETEGVKNAVKVLQKTANPELIWEALQWEKEKQAEYFGVQELLPLMTAYGIVKDLQQGIEVFNPSVDDIMASKAVLFTLIKFVSVDVDLLKKECVARYADVLAPNRETMALMTEEEMMANMHPTARKLYKKAKETAQNAAECSDFYETLSELLKAYKTKEEWLQDSWQSRCKKVPEYLYSSSKKRYELDNLLVQQELWA